MEITKEDREALGRMRDDKAEWAHSALKEYANYDEHDIRTTLVDFIGDAMHLAEKHGLNFKSIIGSAENHFASEGGGGGEPDDIAVATATTDPRWT